MKVESESMCVTPEMAMDWLTHVPFPNQRPITKAKLDEHLRSMKSKNWLPGSTISFGVVPHLGIRYLLNGQHRLTALFEAQINVEFDVKEYVFDKTENDWLDIMKAIYAVEDTGAKRTSTHMIAAYELDKSLGIGKQALRKVLPAVKIIESGFGDVESAGGVLIQDQVKMLSEWQEEIKALTEILPALNGTANSFAGACVLAIMLITIKHVPDKAVPFWKAIIEADGLAKGSAAHTLYRFITENKVRSIDRATYIRKIAAGWNAHYEGRLLTRLQVAYPLGPIRICGTTYKG